MMETDLEPERFELLLDDLEHELENIEGAGYRLREDLGREGQYHIQAGGDFNAYLRTDRLIEHVIRDERDWSEETWDIYRVIEDAYGDLDWP